MNSLLKRRQYQRISSSKLIPLAVGTAVSMVIVAAVASIEAEAAVGNRVRTAKVPLTNSGVRLSSSRNVVELPTNDINLTGAERRSYDSHQADVDVKRGEILAKENKSGLLPGTLSKANWMMAPTDQTSKTELRNRVDRKVRQDRGAVTSGRQASGFAHALKKYEEDMNETRRRNRKSTNYKAPIVLYSMAEEFEKHENIIRQLDGGPETVLLDGYISSSNNTVEVEVENVKRPIHMGMRLHIPTRNDGTDDLPRGRQQTVATIGSGDNQEHASSRIINTMLNSDGELKVDSVWYGTSHYVKDDGGESGTLEYGSDARHYYPWNDNAGNVRGTHSNWRSKLEAQEDHEAGSLQDPIWNPIKSKQEQNDFDGLEDVNDGIFVVTEEADNESEAGSRRNSNVSEEGVQWLNGLNEGTNV